MEKIEIALLFLVGVFIVWVILPWTFWLLVAACVLGLAIFGIIATVKNGGAVHLVLYAVASFLFGLPGRNN